MMDSKSFEMNEEAVKCQEGAGGSKLANDADLRRHDPILCMWVAVARLRYLRERRGAFQSLTTLLDEQSTFYLAMVCKGNK